MYSGSFFILMQRRKDRMSFSIFCKVTARTKCPVVRHYDNNKLMTDESVSVRIIFAVIEVNLELV